MGEMKAGAAACHPSSLLSIPSLLQHQLAGRRGTERWLPADGFLSLLPHLRPSPFALPPPPLPPRRPERGASRLGREGILLTDGDGFLERKVAVAVTPSRGDEGQPWQAHPLSLSLSLSSFFLLAAHRNSPFSSPLSLSNSCLRHPPYTIRSLDWTRGVRRPLPSGMPDAMGKTAKRVRWAPPRLASVRGVGGNSCRTGDFMRRVMGTRGGNGDVSSGWEVGPGCGEGVSSFLFWFFAARAERGRKRGGGAGKEKK